MISAMSRRIFVDVNVLMDVLAQRQPHYAVSAAVWVAIDRHDVSGWVSADSFSTLYYLLRKLSNHAEACRCLQRVCDVFEVAPVDAALIEKALRSPVGDFEDAVQYECALHMNATAIITRDARHFRHAAIPILTPENFIADLELL
jgi:predicted nucleic acid-binding protein